MASPRPATPLGFLPTPSLAYDVRPHAGALRRRAMRFLAVSVGTFFVAVAGFAIAPEFAKTYKFAWMVAFLLSALSAFLGLMFAGRAVARGQQANERASLVLASVVLLVTNGFMMCAGALSALLSTVTFTRGRQIRSFGRVLLPPVEAGGGWAEGPPSNAAIGELLETTEASVRLEVAAQWRQNGRTEHASVAAFARLTLDLMALGAPPALIGSANRDALDEIRHAELCFALARALDGRAESPAAFPKAARSRRLSRFRTLGLAQLAVDSLVDGALHEGVSARIIATLARRCEVPAIRAILKEIAADEGRHAHHGWDVVRWCLAEGGPAVASALEGAMRVLPKQMTSPFTEGARDGSWERWGIMGEELERAEYSAARSDLERRLARDIDETRGRFTVPIAS